MTVTRLHDDLSLIKGALGFNLDRIALFGSVLEKGLTAANDIDLAVFITGLSIEDARRTISGLPLSLTSRVCAADGGYIKAATPTPRKDYHIILLDGNHPDEAFMRFNEGRLRDVCCREN